MYIEIKENKLLSWCEKPYLDYEYVDIDYLTFDPEKYSVINGVLTDITETDEYKLKIEQKEKEKTLEDLKFQIDEIDRKRIRAIAEPQLKDAQSGQTWLEYYTEQISEIRNRISSLADERLGSQAARQLGWHFYF